MRYYLITFGSWYNKGVMLMITNKFSFELIFFFYYYLVFNKDTNSPLKKQ